MMKKKQYIIPIFVPHLGCPNECTFCNQVKISGQNTEVTPEDVRKTIDFYLDSFKEKDAYIEVAFFGGSFTGIDEEVQNSLLEVAKEYVKAKKVNGIRISTRPDYIDKKILKRLKKYKVKTIELGCQSTNDYVLKKAKRGHNFEDIKRASKLIRWYRFNLGHQMMIGMQDSNELDDLQTAKDLSKLKPKMVRIYPVLVIKGTELEKEMKKGEYEPLDLEKAVERCKEIVYYFDKKKIKVIRIGLQTTDTICDPKKNGSEVVGGPYHEAFRQLVESSIFYDIIMDKIKALNMNVKEVEIRVNPADINNVVGFKKENLNRLKELYNISINIEQDEKHPIGKIDLKPLKKYRDFKDEAEDI